MAGGRPHPPTASRGIQRAGGHARSRGYTKSEPSRRKPELLHHADKIERTALCPLPHDRFRTGTSPRSASCPRAPTCTRKGNRHRRGPFRATLPCLHTFFSVSLQRRCPDARPTSACQRHSLRADLAAVDVHGCRAGHRRVRSRVLSCVHLHRLVHSSAGADQRTSAEADYAAPVRPTPAAAARPSIQPQAQPPAPHGAATTSVSPHVGVGLVASLLQEPPRCPPPKAHSSFRHSVSRLFAFV